MLKLNFVLGYLVIVVSALAQTTKTSVPRLGAVLALSGPAKARGEYVRLGIEMAISEANEARGRDEGKIELLIEDSQTNPRDALSAFKKLTLLDGVQVILGDVWAQMTNVMIPISKINKIVLLSPTVVAESVEERSDYFFTMGPKIELAKDAIAKFFEIQPQVKKIALFCWDNPWGNSYAKVWEEVLKEKDIKIVFRSCNPSDFNYDYRTDVAKAVRAAPDAFIIAHESEKIIKLLVEHNYHKPILSTSNVVEVVANGLLRKENTENIYFTDWPPSQEFQGKFQQRYSKLPILEAHDAYEITRAALIALGQVSADTDFLSALKKVSYTGVSGRIDFSQSFSVNYASATLMRLKNGEIVEIGLLTQSFGTSY